MKPTGPLETRLKMLLKDCWERTSQSFAVRETSNDGEAEVVFSLPPGQACFQWHVGGTELFHVLREEKSADGLFMLQVPDGTWEAHVVECKKTVGLKTWKKAREQMGWTLARLRAVSGVVGFTVSRVVCYTAFREERQSPAKSMNPTDFKSAVGPGRSSPGSSSADFALVRQWEEGAITFEGLEGPIPHRKIELDPATGRAQLNLASSCVERKGTS